MQFYCSECQKKHDVGDISADMLSIGARDIVEGIDHVIDELCAKNPDSQESLVALQMELQCFLKYLICADEYEKLIHVKNEKGYADKTMRPNALFALPGKTIRQETGEYSTGINYTYRVTLEQLYRYFMLYAPKKNVDALELFRQSCIDQYLKDVVVWETNLHCLFDEDVRNTLYCVLPEEQRHPYSHVRICPHCGRELSYAAGTGEEIVVGLAGAPRSGKTTCLVSLVNTLLQEQIPNLRIRLDGEDGQWENLHKKLDLYRKGVTLEKTPHTILQVPSISFKLKVGKGPVTVLTIVDLPGEFWGPVQHIAPHMDFFNRYVGLFKSIDCIWFALSKSYVNCIGMDSITVNNALAEDFSMVSYAREGADPNHLRQNLRLLSQYLASKGKKMPPALVMLTKADLFFSPQDVEEACDQFPIYPKVGPDPEAYKYPQVKVCVTDANAEDLSAVLGQEPLSLQSPALWRHACNVRAYIQQANRTLVSAIEENFPKRFYISHSAYGWPAVPWHKYADQLREAPESLRFTPPVPYHETYPLLWTLAIHNALPVCHKVVVIKKFVGKPVGVITQDHCYRFHHNADLFLAGSTQVHNGICANLLLRGAKENLRFTPTEVEEKMTLRQFLAYKRNKK